MAYLFTRLKSLSHASLSSHCDMRGKRFPELTHCLMIDGDERSLHASLGPNVLLGGRNNVN